MPDSLASFRESMHPLCGWLAYVNVSLAQLYLTLLIRKSIFLFTTSLFMHWKDQYQQSTSADNLIRAPWNGYLQVYAYIHLYKRAKTPVKTTLDFYSSLPMKMQTMNHLKGLLMRQLKDFFCWTETPQ